ncbi:hypothetical protein [Epilithonimonas hispanica]|uniref:hypothetical protein n=1 Tax=Epilithonimonas hispanica TaxID=358687 RepID=UPI000F4E3A6C|nr:hypothetical protein [Epilithonimonas hispanica]
MYLNNKLISDKIKVVNAIFLNKEKILFLGEYYDGNGFNFGFFYFDLNTKTIEKLNIIRSDSLSFFPKLFLQYTGNFKKYENKIVYVNEKSSNAWVIENTEISEFATKDKTPLPTIINSDNNYYYERGKTYNTNSDFFLTEKNVCVFSNRTENKNEIVIDLYKYNGKYVNNS